jgi:hypothetical protein
MQAETVAVTWGRAWSPYPLRVVLTDVAADGQTPTEQWQLDARGAGLSVSLLPLLQKGEIRVQDLDMTDIDLRVRPRLPPKPVQEQARHRIADYFPVIRNRDPTAAAEAAPEATGAAFVLEIDDIHVNGTHSFWVSHIRGTLPGSVRGNFRMDTGAGEFSLAGGALDLALTSLVIGPEEPVTDAAAVKGRIEVPAFRLSEVEGLQLMRLPELLDAEVDLPVQSLDFIAWLMPPLEELDLHGQGRLSGRLVMARGEVLGGTDLVVEARELAMGFGPYDFSGDGQIELSVNPEDESQADLEVRFDQVRAALDPPASNASEQPEILFTGQGLSARLHAAEVDPTTTSTAQRIEELQSEVKLGFRLDIPLMRVDDLSVYNRLFPDTWDLALQGGTGTVSGAIEVTEERLSLSLDLASDEADLRVVDYHANTDLLLQLRAVVEARSARQGSATLDLAGTLVRLEDAQLDQAATAADDAEAQHWTAQLRVDNADLRLPLSPDQRESGPVLGATRTLSDEGFGALLARADGGASVALTLSRLDWIADLLDRPMGLSLKGAEELDADIRFAQGLPVAGSALRIPREALTVKLLDHQIDGSGEASLTLEQSGRQPLARLAIALHDARVHRQGEEEPSVGDVRLDAAIRVRDPFAKTVADAAAGAGLQLKIHSARIPDMRTYNPYLPANGPVRLLGGEASLVGEMSAKADTAKGQMLLTADGIRVAVDDEEFLGDLRLELLIRDGAAKDLRFDISGSSLLLTGFRVVGANASTADPDWHARLQLEESEIRWRKPMELAMKADITVKDTRPLVAVMDNLRGKHDWIDDLATIQDLGGHIVLAVQGDDATLEDAMLSGPEIGVHAKGHASETAQEAMLLLRWHDLLAALEIQGDRKHFDVVGARARFDAYTPGKTPLASVGTAVTGNPSLDTSAQRASLERATAAPEQYRGALDRAPQHNSDGGTRRSDGREPKPSADNPFQDHSL